MYSTLNFDNYPDIKFRDEKDLNNKISECGGDHARLSIHNGNLEFNSKSGEFNGDKEFAELLSKYLTDGKVRLIYKSEEDCWGYEILPDKVDKLTFLAFNTAEFEEYTDFKELKKDLNDIHQSLFIPQWFNKGHFEDILDKKLTDTQFQRIKDHLIDGSGDYLAESISESIRIDLNEILINIPEIF
jgi:hypothetical protein